MAIFDTIKAKVQGGTGALKNINADIGNAGETIAGKVKTGANAVLNNDAVKTGIGAVNQVNNLYQNVKGLVGAAKSFLEDPYQIVPNPLLGGYSRKETQKLANRALKTAYAKNNLFLVRLTDRNYPTRAGKVKFFPNEFDSSEKPQQIWDLFAMGVSYNPIAITGDAVKIGFLQGDSIQQSERVEIRMTFFDNTIGTIKRYLMAKKKQMINSDGTGNTPNNYFFNLQIIHLDQTVGAQEIGFGSNRKRIGIFDEDTLIRDSYFKNEYLVRVGSLDIDLNKREDSLQELQVTFVEVDPFMYPV